MTTLRDAPAELLGDYGMRSAREARVNLRKQMIYFARHGRQSLDQIKALPVGEFRALLRELQEQLSEEWAPET